MLVKLKVPTDRDGAQPVADVRLTYRDLSNKRDASAEGNLALAIPEAANGGRTFTFRLRPRIRYSTGRLVQASDFVRGMQRLFRIHSPGGAFFDHCQHQLVGIERPAKASFGIGNNGRPKIKALFSSQ